MIFKSSPILLCLVLVTGKHHHPKQNNGGHHHGGSKNHIHDSASSSVSNRAGCGVPIISPITRIVGGFESIAHSWPWMAVLEHNGVQSCGGSILDQYHILTAAHCVDQGADNPRNWRIGVGKHHKSNYESTEQWHNVQSIIPHPSYNVVGILNDIAIMRLRTPITFNNHVQPVCVAQSHFAAGTFCVAAGWGLTSTNGQDSDVLLQVTVPLVDDATCNAMYGGQIDYFSMLCAGYDQGGKDSCTRDSGGPLVCKYNGAWYQVGVTSWGAGCGLANRPGVYADVANYVSWIRGQGIQV